MAIYPDSRLFCVIAYFLGAKVFVSNLDPLVRGPQELIQADIDQVIGLLEEHTLPSDFRRAVPGYMKHHFYTVQTEERLGLLFNTLFKLILGAMERRQSVLIYSRRPEFCTAVVVALWLRAHLIAPHLLLYAPLQAIPKTRETYTLSYLHFLEQVYPHALLTADLTRILHGYERLHIIPPSPPSPPPSPPSSDPEIDSDPWAHFVADFVSFLIPDPPVAPPVPPTDPPNRIN